ncbi:hypothetical protein A4X09_0g6760 [Tilletia walkeri]|uniref:Uncharacterized protein n=1 Tax=Tilletia walkeri TaxID=117179 RepID=A0A8X7T232_9BASI|nr:hypothetical protein A4X09_0g6760 [Tilletia walkeri]
MWLRKYELFPPPLTILDLLVELDQAEILFDFFLLVGVELDALEDLGRIDHVFIVVFDSSQDLNHGLGGITRSRHVGPVRATPLLLDVGREVFLQAQISSVDVRNVCSVVPDMITEYLS